MQYLYIISLYICNLAKIAFSFNNCDSLREGLQRKSFFMPPLGIKKIAAESPTPCDSLGARPYFLMKVLLGDLYNEKNKIFL
jgi:hypothetical protein